MCDLQINTYLARDPGVLALGYWLEYQWFSDLCVKENIGLISLYFYRVWKHQYAKHIWGYESLSKI